MHAVSVCRFGERAERGGGPRYAAKCGRQPQLQLDCNMKLTCFWLWMEGGFEYEIGNLFYCTWKLGRFRIRQVLATADGENAVPPDLFVSDDRTTILRTVGELEAHYLSTTGRLLPV